MPIGVQQDGITTNGLVTRFMPDLVRRLTEEDAFSPLFKPDVMPEGFSGTQNYVIDTTFDTAPRQAPGSHRESKKRGGYEINVSVGDKIRDSRQITWEAARRSRFREVQIQMDLVADTVFNQRMTLMGNKLLTNSLSNTGTPTDPSAAAAGQTPDWWNTNDTIAPPQYATTTFSAGHDHVETAVTALTQNRVGSYIDHVTEHGYGKTGMVAFIQNQENRTLLNLANVAQQSRTTGVALTDIFQKSGSASAANGFMGVEWIVNQWVPAGVVGVFDRNLAGLPSGGAVKVIEQDIQTSTEIVDDTQSTWVEAWEQFEPAILHKAAGYVAHVA